MNIYKLLLLVVVSSCSFNNKKSDWLVQSNQLADQYTKESAAFYPEHASHMGYQQFDKLGMNPTIEHQEKYLKFLKSWVGILEKKKVVTNEKNLLVDIQILLDRIHLDIDEIEYKEKEGVLDLVEVNKIIYYNLFSLINAQTSPERKSSGVDRFKYYMNQNGKRSIVEEFINVTKNDLRKYQSNKIIYPYVGQVKKYLEDSPSITAGIKEVLAQSGRSDWTADYNQLVKELKDYDQFITQTILPKARKDPRLPLSQYILQLKGYGVTTHPDDLIKNGLRDYKEVYKDFSKIAQEVAKKHALSKNDPASVIKALKSKFNVTGLDELKVIYDEVNTRLEKIIIENKLVSLPKEKLQMRFAGDAESKTKPVPHVTVPPIINNKGEKSEFVIPTSSTGKLPFDDFSNKFSAMALSAHEGRPGHDLQFSRMLENPISIVRARYAMNSVNVEGWGLHAEDLVLPYLELEEKLFIMQTKLWRMARYYLDPMVQLGKVDESKVVSTLHNELGMSQEMARLEYQRYAFRSSGQATAYYQGLLNIRDLKSDLEKNLGSMTLKCFHDHLLSFGIMPHEHVRLFEDEFKRCAL